MWPCMEDGLAAEGCRTGLRFANVPWGGVIRASTRRGPSAKYSRHKRPKKFDGSTLTLSVSTFSSSSPHPRPRPLLLSRDVRKDGTSLARLFVFAHLAPYRSRPKSQLKFPGIRHVAPVLPLPSIYHSDSISLLPYISSSHISITIPRINHVA
jgi:hypothetical protein